MCFDMEVLKYKSWPCCLDNFLKHAGLLRNYSTDLETNVTLQ